MGEVLQVRDLKLRAHTPSGELVLLDDVQLELRQGEILGVVGESGSGKTSLVRTLIGMLAGNVEVVDGRVEVQGELVMAPGVDRAAQVRGSQIGTVFQDASRSLNPLLKVRTQLREVLKRHRPELSRQEAHAQMVRVLQRMQITDAERVIASYPHQLSGGMRQRVAIAIAVIASPALVLADECTSALDVTTQAEVVSLFRDLVSGSGIALVFVTHDLLLASDLCDRVAVMYGGQVVESGPTERVLRNPRHPYTAGLLSAAPSWSSDAPLRGIPGSVPWIGEGFVGCHFAGRCSQAEPECGVQDIGWTQLADRDGFRCRRPLVPGAPGLASVGHAASVDPGSDAGLPVGSGGAG